MDQIAHILEDESLTDNLSDDQAKPLLKWLESTPAQSALTVDSAASFVRSFNRQPNSRPHRLILWLITAKYPPRKLINSLIKLINGR